MTKVEPAKTCSVTQPFFRMTEAHLGRRTVGTSDALVLICDLAPGHGGPHHDPVRRVEWFGR